MTRRLNEAVEIRWHGRGGQGAKTACMLLADVAFNSGKHVQGFPEYGPERMVHRLQHITELQMNIAKFTQIYIHQTM